MINFKKLTPHLIALGVFVVICFAYFSPVLGGKVLQMHDMMQAKAMSHEINEYHDKTGIDPHWTNSMFSGMPAYQIVGFSKNNFIQFFYLFIQRVFPEPAWLLLLNLIGFYVLLTTLKVDYRLSIAGAIAFAFSSYFFVIISAGHITKAMAIAASPLVLAGILKTLRGNIIGGGLLTLLAFWMEIYSNHPQITYYLLIIIGLLMIFEFIGALRNKTLPAFFKACVVILVAAILGAVPSTNTLWSTYEYSKYTTRSPSELESEKGSTGLPEDYALAWSYGIGETWTLLIPGAKGGASDEDIGTNSATYKALKDNGAAAQAKDFVKQAPIYWGDQPFTAGPIYAGAISVFLFVLALFMVKGSFKWWAVASLILICFLGWGKNFQSFADLFFNYFPGYNKFRTVEMILAFAPFVLALLGFYGLKLFLDAPKTLEKVNLKKLTYAFYLTGGVCLLFALVPGVFFNFTGPVDEQLKSYPDWLLGALKEDRESILRTDAFRSFMMISAAAGLIWFYMKGKLKLEYMYLGLCFMVLLDLWVVDKRYLNSDNFISEKKQKAIFTPSAADQQILRDTTYFRVMNTAVSTFNDATTSYFHHSIGGYHGAKLKRYQELIEHQMGKGNINVMSMLNTKYVIVQDKKTGELQAQQNQGALGPAWFVKEYKIVPNADSELNALTDFDPAKTAIVDKRFESNLAGFQPSQDSTASIKFISEAPDHLVYETKSSNKQLAVFSEIYYEKGWNAYVDGNLTPHFRVNYVLRAMIVPEGNHKIEFKFEPANYNKAEKVSLAGSILIVLLFAGYGISVLRKKEEAPVA